MSDPKLAALYSNLPTTPDNGVSAGDCRCLKPSTGRIGVSR